jgi:Icc-related predicted phosphoesterase
LKLVDPMKVKYVSDLHLEFSRFPTVDAQKELAPSKKEVLLVAGDTVLAVALQEKRTDAQARAIKWRFDEFLDAVSGFKSVYMIGGNHEAYSGGDFATVGEIIKEYIARRSVSNVHYLENERAALTPKVDLLACTLWTDMGKRNPSIMWEVGRRMNDFHTCNYKGVKFTTEDAADLFDMSKAWLQKELLDTSKSYVVMTHHCPSFQSIDPAFKADDMNYGYASDMDDMIYSNPHITHWVHGHTHYNVDYKIGETRILGNMRGYPPNLTSHEPNWQGFKTKEFNI